MTQTSFKVYPYRWVILAVFMFINLTIQVLWICYAPITGPAAKFYGVTDLQIGLLAMSFMIVYVPLSIPISWLIDTLGYRKAVSIGAILMGLFGILRGFMAADYTWVWISTLGIAAAQPFLLNSISTVAAKWFPIEERATASGLAMVASFVGIAVGEVLSPILMLNYGIVAMQMIYGFAAAFSVLLFLVFTREAPPTPPCPEDQEARALMFDGLKEHAAAKRDLDPSRAISGWDGYFNGISTWIEDIVRPKGLSVVEAGNLAGFLMLGGILGAALIPMLSDRLRKRRIFLFSGMAFALPGLIGFTFFNSYWSMVVSLFSLGFFLMSLAPIGYQYAAEITYPAPEGTSNGLLNMAGQISVVFIFGMEAFKNQNGSFSQSLILLIGFLIICCALVPMMQESELIQADVKV